MQCRVPSHVYSALLIVQWQREVSSSTQSIRITVQGEESPCRDSTYFGGVLLRSLFPVPVVFSIPKLSLHSVSSLKPLWVTFIHAQSLRTLLFDYLGSARQFCPHIELSSR